jgi:hypothetical protein
VLLSVGSRLAYSDARCRREDMEDGVEPRQGTRSTRARRYPSHRRRIRQRPHCDNPVRIHLRRWRHQCRERWRKEPRSKMLSSDLSCQPNPRSTGCNACSGLKTGVRQR